MRQKIIHNSVKTYFHKIKSSGNLIKNGLKLVMGQPNSSKKITYMRRRWGKPQNSCLRFTDEFEKQLKIKKTVALGQ